MEWQKRQISHQFMSGVFNRIQKEVGQDHCLRKPLLSKIKKLRAGKAVVSFFISFYSRAPLSQEDADMIEEVLCNTDTTNGICLILDAPGGDGLAAERIIQICRRYSKGDFETIVPARAKSAATMVCLGSDRILLSPVSELGPIDPQIPIKIGENWQWVAAHHVIKTYDKLMADAVALQQGHIEPYLQQLAQFNATQIEMFRSATRLSEHIAITSLAKGMLKGTAEKEIKARIKCFTDPEITLSHGRALNIEHLANSGLKVEEIDLRSELWLAVRDLYVRSKFVVDRGESGRKLVDSLETSYRAA
jgi:ClpP class serine protease